MPPLPIILTILVLLGIVFFLYLSLGSRRTRDIPSRPPKKHGRISDSTWMSAEEFERFVKTNRLVRPKNSDVYGIWIREGTFVVAAVSMKSGDRVAVSQVSML